MELKAESRAESGFPQGTLLPNIRSPGPTRLTVQQKLSKVTGASATLSQHFFSSCARWAFSGTVAIF
jgi:hypothetical protein